MNLETWKKSDAPEDDPFRKRLLRVANVPQRKWEADLDRADPAAAKAVRAYMDGLKENIETGDGLLLWGKYRVGKSCLAACVAREAAAHRARVYWLDGADLADSWMQRDEYFVQSRSAQLLIVDDVGVEGGVEFRKEMMGRALRYRLERGMATVLTTNMAPPAFKQHYGGKITALLQEVVKLIEVIPWGGASREEKRNGGADYDG